MATQIGTGTGTTLATFIPDLTDTANVQTALKQLYYGTVGGTLSQTTGIYGALYTLYTGNPTLAGNVTITGTLTVNGTTTTINSTTLSVDDKLIEVGAVASPTNTTADGGGLSLFGTTNKTILWDNANANWTTSENWNLTTGKTLKINNVDIASGTGAALVLGANASTTIAIGANGGTATILNPTVTLTNATALNLNGATSVTVAGSAATTANIFNTTQTTVNVGQAATTLSLGATTGTGSIRNATVTFPNATAMTLGTTSPTITFGTGPTLTTASGTVTLFNTGATTLNMGGAATTMNLGSASAGTSTLQAGTTLNLSAPTVTLGTATLLNINGASPSIVTTSTGTASVFNTNALSLSLGNAATTGNLVNAATTLNIGNTTTSAQTVNMFTASTAGGTYNIATAASSSGTKAINIGTGGTTGSTTTINIGTAGGTGTVNINGTANIGKVLLQTVTTSAGASTLTFSGISQAYESIEVVYTVGTANTAATTVAIQFAGDTSTNYGYSFQSVSGSSTTNTTAPSYNNGFDQTSILVPMNHPSNSTIGHIAIENYNSTSGAKIGTFNGGYDYISDGFTNGTFHWKNRTTAVTSMTLTFGGTVTGQVVTAQLFGLN